ncbi:MAG: N-acetylmuramoyl-L-alanine amidase [Candidatus Omnitrophica bacterium]|nr:N-acetylmuramoyl-L-alanine amidase [Candidatus Omnitrophota bacterium]
MDILTQTKKLKCICLIIFLVLSLSSCSRAPVRKTMPLPPIQPRITPEIFPPGMRSNIVHVVAPGETVWRIGKMYDVSIEHIVRENKLKNSSMLEKGQRLNISQAAPVRPVVTLYPSKKWKYIIIHHSATDSGSALGFDKSHQARGFNRGLGYDFVIANGTADKLDGQIEVSPRWIKQEDGAHCKAGNMNCRAIGICLVGNFSQERVSLKQIDSLIYLVNRLRKYYKIPKKNILGHGQVKGANTECPGSKFPWADFKSKL